MAESWVYRRHDDQLEKELEHQLAKEELKEHGPGDHNQEVRDQMVLYRIASTIINFWYTDDS